MILLNNFLSIANLKALISGGHLYRIPKRSILIVRFFFIILFNQKNAFIRFHVAKAQNTSKIFYNYYNNRSSKIFTECRIR